MGIRILSFSNLCILWLSAVPVMGRTVDATSDYYPRIGFAIGSKTNQFEFAYRALANQTGVLLFGECGASWGYLSTPLSRSEVERPIESGVFLGAGIGNGNQGFTVSYLHFFSDHDLEYNDVDGGISGVIGQPISAIKYEFGDAICVSAEQVLLYEKVLVRLSYLWSLSPTKLVAEPLDQGDYPVSLKNEFSDSERSLDEIRVGIYFQLIR